MRLVELEDTDRGWRATLDMDGLPEIDFWTQQFLHPSESIHVDAEDTEGRPLSSWESMCGLTAPESRITWSLARGESGLRSIRATLTTRYIRRKLEFEFRDIEVPR